MPRERPSRRRLGQAEGEDPLAGVANFFDLGLVIALGFLLALVAYLGLPELLQRDDVTLVKDPGTPQMEIIRKDGVKLERYRVSERQASGDGERLGTAWRLASGEVVYVPEGSAKPGATSAGAAAGSAAGTGQARRGRR